MSVYGTAMSINSQGKKKNGSSKTIQIIIIIIKIIKVKGVPERPGVAQRVPGGLGSQIHEIRHMNLVRLSASGTGRLYPQKMFLVLIFTRG